MASGANIYLNRRMAVLLALGFSSGLPFALTADTLQAWMTDRGVDLGVIGLFGLVALPYSLKFLWAPLIDRYVPPLLGRRRGWMLIWQIAIILTLLVMSGIGGSPSLVVIAATALGIAFCSASQDIVVDAYRADVLPPDERGAGSAVSVMGYRIGFILSGAGALFLVGKHDVPWPVIYAIMACAMSVGVIATLLAPEPARGADPPASLASAVVAPFAAFIARRGGWLILLFVLLFKLPDIAAGKMTLPFMLKIGIAMEDIAVVRQWWGMIITIVGALVGGAIVARLKLWPSLWLFGILQAVSNLGFYVLAQVGPRYDAMVAVICLENFCTGLVTAGFTAFLISQCHPKYSATQFALLTSVMALARDLLGAPTGYFADQLGWPMFFLLSVVLAVPGLMLMPWVRRLPTIDAPEASGFEALPANPRSAAPVAQPT